MRDMVNEKWIQSNDMLREGTDSGENNCSSAEDTKDTVLTETHVKIM
jgi:uncharacterized protein YheU (UPF0270 family)